jgi:hypothetical protein
MCGAAAVGGSAALGGATAVGGSAVTRDVVSARSPVPTGGVVPGGNSVPTQDALVMANRRRRSRGGVGDGRDGVCGGIPARRRPAERSVQAHDGHRDGNCGHDADNEQGAPVRQADL